MTVAAVVVVAVAEERKTVRSIWLQSMLRLGTVNKAHACLKAHVSKCPSTAYTSSCFEKTCRTSYGERR